MHNPPCFKVRASRLMSILIRSGFRPVLANKWLRLIPRGACCSCKSHFCTSAPSEGSSENRKADSGDDASDVIKNRKVDNGEGDIKKRLLDLAIEFVPEYGWSKEALSQAAKTLGFPSVAHGLIPRGGIDLILYFEKKSNKQIVDDFYPKSPRAGTDEQTPNVSTFLADIIQARLTLIEPYIDKWPQALALKAQPWYIEDAFTNLGLLVDDMWYLAGDDSTDMNWYTKRASLAAIYSSAELYYLQDGSSDRQNTQAFIQKRMDNFKALMKARKKIESRCNSTFQLLGVAASTVTNLLRYTLGYPDLAYPEPSIIYLATLFERALGAAGHLAHAQLYSFC
eukprot:m.66277 g.66277  ORF g.66277 m.66277 type:complete len:339 (+) comp35376_c0_seq6:45-1061(+)